MDTTEDDTYKALKRIPYKEMKRMVDKIAMKDSSTLADIALLLRRNGWTLDDYERHV